MRTDHTPGPWYWEFHPDTRKPIALVGKGRDVLIATGTESMSWAEVGPADRALIAAAPDLLDAVRGLLMCSLPGDISGQRFIDEARAALLKATGGDGDDD